jgi:hypothetical protein
VQVRCFEESSREETRENITTPPANQAELGNECYGDHEMVRRRNRFFLRFGGGSYRLRQLRWTRDGQPARIVTRDLT